tara:strand:- start:9056 stop:10702 length:1647 start_codon:yes stop_codon:yes gene_type:complete
MKKILLIALLLNASLVINAQNINAKIDQVFSDWNQKNHPGGVVSIMKKGEVVFSKAYGLANIKYKIPNTTETVFNIGSVSKQFTAMGIVLLNLEGKLSIDDDFRKYLPELYDFDNKITIRHLLHHTSGFRSTPELFGLAGWRDGDPITTEDDYRYFSKQTSLNFEPGTQFMYTNSGYVLLAKIIEQVTQQPFSLWMHDNVFLPLKMASTFVDETNSNTLAQIATPYNQYEPGPFTIGENTSLDIGASNIYTTANDLTIWMKNFRTPTKGWKLAFDMLQTVDVLNNGSANNYAFGVFLDNFLGNRRIQHSGGVPGFLSNTAYYPDEDLTIVLLSNFISFISPEDKYIMLSQLLLKDKTPKTEAPQPIKGIAFDSELAKKIAGDYWNDKENYPRRVYAKNDTLWYLRDNGVQSPLIQVKAHQFIIGGIETVVSVEFEEGEKNKMIITDGNSLPQILEEYDSSPLTTIEKEAYTGQFYSPELETTYTISLINDQLMGYHSRHGEFPIGVLKKDVTDWSGMAIVKYTRDEKGETNGIYVDMNRVENVWFQKK